MPSQFNSPEGNLEDYFVSESWLIDQYIGDKLYAWGENQYGQLGDNNNTDRSTPVTTFAGGTNWKQVSGGIYNTAAVKTDGTLWTWGYNNYGHLGTNDDNTSTTRYTPVTTFAGGTNWTQVACGYEHTMALKVTGVDQELYVWGYNNTNQLGILATEMLVPSEVYGNATDWKYVNAGFRATVAIKTDGTLWNWGYNGYGNLGNNSYSLAFTPVTTFVGGYNWKQANSGYANVAAIKTDGTLWTWGRGSSFGLLGNNAQSNKNTPVTTFAGGNTWKQVSAYQYSVAAIRSVDFL